MNLTLLIIHPDGENNITHHETFADLLTYINEYPQVIFQFTVWGKSNLKPQKVEENEKPV